MQSRIEDILQAMIDGTSSSELPPAQSRNEALLMGVLDKLNDLDVDPEVIKQAVDDWLDDHPEATTTVEDGAITYAKLDSTLKAKSDDVDELKSATTDLEQYVRDLSPVVTAGPSPVVSVSDAAPLDAEDVTIAVEPVQDLHGYDSPWPAGGGKNICPPFVPSNGAGLTVVSNPDGSLSVSGTATGGGYITEFVNLPRVIPAGSNLVLSLKNSIPVRLRSFFDNSVSDINAGNTASAVSTASTDITKVRLYLFATAGTEYNFTIYYQLESGTSVSAWSPYSNICPISGWTGANLFHGADQTDYDTLSVAFPTAAGTIYGGTLDLTAGTLTVDRAIVDLGTLNYGVTNSRFSADVSGMAPVVAPPYINRLTGVICSQYPPDSQVSISDAMTDKTWIRMGSGIIIKDTDYTTPASFKSAMSGVQLVYPLATPIVYTLDPVTLTLLRGNNAVWADCGDTTLTYRQDVATLLSALTAPDETDMTANANYAINSFFTVGGTLYRATAAIATGETIVPGSNCVATTIADQLTYLYSQI